MRKIISLLLLSLAFISASFASSNFVVQKIEVEGLQRISADTVYSYLPIKTGQTMTAQKSAEVIRDLYKTGFFEHISVSRVGNTLVIHVDERSTIGKLKISGNNLIQTDKLTSVMKGLDIAEGRSYNRSVLERIQQSLINQYYELGHYNARVDVDIKPMERNRVLVDIKISEGLVAKIRRINIIGNHAYSEGTLLDQFSMTTPGLFTWITQKDQYTQEKLEGSIEALRNYYLDRGYVKFAVKSSEVEITPDRKSVYISIAINEGDTYKVSGVTLMGDLILPRQELMKLITIKKGDIFSRQAVIDSEKKISEALGDKGYLFAQMNLSPNINDNTREVFLTIEVKPGKRQYVRHIYFSENVRTNDVVYRREMQQMEASVVSTKKLEESKRRLNILPYVRNVDMQVDKVPGTENQVDVHYKMTEQSSAEISGRIGYSQLEHVILGAGINQKNFLGTGETLGINFQQSRFLQEYAVSFTDPYYTPDGIARTISLAVNKYNAGNANTSNYSSDDYAANVMYSIPLRDFLGDAINRLQLGYGYSNTLITLQSTSSGLTPPSLEMQDFVQKHGRHFQQVNFSVGLSRDSRDRSIFPTRGMLQSAGLDFFLPVASESLHYYTASYTNSFYQPLTHDYILTTRGALAYGNSFSGGARDFPFFRYFNAGGIGTVGAVRGYLGNSLGPRDSNDKPTGGNFLADASLGLIFPNYISENLRTTFFIDAGNVYKTYDNRSLGGSATGSLRYAAGIDAQWFVPFLGTAIEFSLAKAIRAHRNASDPDLRDQLEGFQFSLGANLG